MPAGGALPDAIEGPRPPKRMFGEMKLWTGTWNMGAVDPFQALGDLTVKSDEVARLLSPFVSGSAGRATAARIQLHGVGGSLGNALEDLCRPQLAAVFLGATQNHEALVMRTQVAMVEAGGASSAGPASWALKTLS